MSIPLTPRTATHPTHSPSHPRNDHGQLGLGDTRSRWLPAELKGFRAVHPDRTLRKNKRSLPRMRPIVRLDEPQWLEPARGAAKAFFFTVVSKLPGKSLAPTVEAATGACPSTQVVDSGTQPQLDDDEASS